MNEFEALIGVWHGEGEVPAEAPIFFFYSEVQSLNYQTKFWSGGPFQKIILSGDAARAPRCSNIIVMKFILLRNSKRQFRQMESTVFLLLREILHGLKASLHKTPKNLERALLQIDENEESQFSSAAY